MGKINTLLILLFGSIAAVFGIMYFRKKQTGENQDFTTFVPQVAGSAVAAVNSSLTSMLSGTPSGNLVSQSSLDKSNSDVYNLDGQLRYGQVDVIKRPDSIPTEFKGIKFAAIKDLHIRMKDYDKKFQDIDKSTWNKEIQNAVRRNRATWIRQKREDIRRDFVTRSSSELGVPRDLFDYFFQQDITQVWENIDYIKKFSIPWTQNQIDIKNHIENLFK